MRLDEARPHLHLNTYENPETHLPIEFVKALVELPAPAIAEADLVIVIQQLKRADREQYGLKDQPYLPSLLTKMTESDSFEPSFVGFPKKLEDRIIERVQKEFHLRRK